MHTVVYKIEGQEHSSSFHVARALLALKGGKLSYH